MILMNDFNSAPEELKRAYVGACERVVRGGWYILGNEVKKFESQWSAYCGASHCIGVANGLDAIEIGLRASNVGPGDEVITTPTTAVATVLAITRAGATPVLADIDLTTGTIDMESVKRCLSPRTKGVLLVHLYGHATQMDAWVNFCAEHNIALFEDCAQAHGATWKGKQAGNFGAWGAYSFYPTKNLGCLGDGGALVCNQQDLAEKSRMIRNYGQSERYHHPVLGLNSRLDEMQAAILQELLPYLSNQNSRRREIAHAYFEGLKAGQFELMARPVSPENHVHHLFVIKTTRRAEMQKYLKEKGVETLIHYPVPVHHQVPYKNILRDPKGLAKAEHYANQCLSLPCHPYLSHTQVKQVIEATNSFK